MGRRVVGAERRRQELGEPGRVVVIGA